MLSRSVCFLFCLAPMLTASPLYFLSSGHTGAQTQLDVTHIAEWSFTPASLWELGGGRFVMKSGSKTTSPITFSIYRGTDSSTGALLGALTLSNQDFCNKVANCGQFNTREFKLSFPIELSTGVNYYAQLTSDAPDRQAEAYFIKASRIFDIEDQGGLVVTAQAIADPAAIPEPHGLSLLGLVLLVRRKRGERMRPPR